MDLGYLEFVIHFLTASGFVSDCTLGGDKVSMWTYAYPHKPLRKIKMTICNHQSDSPPLCDLMSDLVICKFRNAWSYMTPNVLTENRCHKTTQTLFQIGLVLAYILFMTEHEKGLGRAKKLLQDTHTHRHSHMYTYYEFIMIVQNVILKYFHISPAKGNHEQRMLYRSQCLEEQ